MISFDAMQNNDFLLHTYSSTTVERTQFFNCKLSVILRPNAAKCQPTVSSLTIADPLVEPCSSAPILYLVRRWGRKRTKTDLLAGCQVVLCFRKTNLPLVGKVFARICIVVIM